MMWFIDNGVLTRKKSTTAIPFEVEDGAAELIIPECVTKLGFAVFRDCDTLTSVTLPESIVEIGTYAFHNCRQLGTINLPQGLTKIGQCAFYGCTSLKRISIPDTVTEIAARAFTASGLTEIMIPDSVQVLGERIFGDCPHLTSFTVPNDYIKIEQHAFDNAGLKHLYVAHPVAEVVKDWRLNDDVMIHTDDPEALPMNRRRLSRLANVMDGKDLTTDVGKDAAKYAAANAVKHLMLILEEPKLFHAMLQSKLISARDIDAFQEAARKTGHVEQTAALLEYQANGLAAADVAKARKKKEQARDAALEKALDGSGNPLEGLVFSLTGNLWDIEVTRAELKAILASNGAKLTPHVTAKTNYLVQGGWAENDKVEQAAALSVDIIDEREFLAMLLQEIDGVFFDQSKEWLVSAKKLNGSEYVVPKGVKGIADHAFEDCYKLHKVNIPASVTRIGDHTFRWCDKELTIHAPSGSYAIQHAKKMGFHYRSKKEK